MKQHITLLLPALLLLSLGAAPQEEDPTAPYLAGVKERFSGFEELKQTAPFDYSVRGEGEAHSAACAAPSALALLLHRGLSFLSAPVRRAAKL